MKYIIPLFLISFSAFGACPVTNCQTNFACAEAAVKADPEADVSSYTEYSSNNYCGDGLRFVSLLAESEDSVTTTASTNLPLIPDAPVRAPASQE